MKAYSDYGIDIPNNKYKGEVVAICPECSHTRKKKKEKFTIPETSCCYFFKRIFIKQWADFVWKIN